MEKYNMADFNSNIEIAQEISNRIGTAPIPFESVYALCLKIYQELGGTEDNFGDIYSILLEILPLVKSSKNIDYLSFTNVGEDTIYITCFNSNGEYPVESDIYSIFQYSNDKANWNNLGNGYIQMNPNDKVYFRGKLLNTASTTAKFLSFKAYMDSGLTESVTTGCIKAGGDLTSMVNCEYSQEVPNYAFPHLFAGFVPLIQAPNINAKVIGDIGCLNIFNGCTNLVNPPILPATKVGNDGYKQMFRGCTSLTTAPSLPAMNLGMAAYNGMFYGCSSLTTAPELPALIVPFQAYAYMFASCTNLIQPPSTLPATKVGYGAYYRMFRECSNLEYSPDIMVNDTINMYADYPITEGLYWKRNNSIMGMICKEMFRSCSKLKMIRCFIKRINDTSLNNSQNFKDWVNGVAATGKIVIASGSTGWVTGADGKPSGWTVDEI